MAERLYPLPALRQKVETIAGHLPGTWEIISAKKIRRQRNIVIKRTQGGEEICFEFTMDRGACYMPTRPEFIEITCDIRASEEVIAQALERRFLSNPVS